MISRPISWTSFDRSFTRHKVCSNCLLSNNRLKSTCRSCWRRCCKNFHPWRPSTSSCIICWLKRTPVWGSLRTSPTTTEIANTDNMATDIITASNRNKKWWWVIKEGSVPTGQACTCKASIRLACQKNCSYLRTSKKSKKVGRSRQRNSMSAGLEKRRSEQLSRIKWARTRHSKPVCRC